VAPELVKLMFTVDPVGGPLKVPIGGVKDQINPAMSAFGIV
jgi:hypothetical protein